jgi:IS30 family transposase
LYVRQGLSAREIGRLLDVSHSTVLSAINGFGLDGKRRRDDQRRRKGQIPFGYVLVDHRLEKCAKEQAVIRLVRQLRANGKTLRAISEELNRRLIPTKNHGLWQAATVKKILDRAARPTPVKTEAVF